MTYKEFSLRFAIQYVGSVSDPGECMRRIDKAPSLARLLWDTIQNAELPESEKIKQSLSASLEPSNSFDELLKAIAVIALHKLPSAKWIAQDGDGRWYAYDVKPANESECEWFELSETGDIEFIIELTRPKDISKELYRIATLGV